MPRLSKEEIAVTLLAPFWNQAADMARTGYASIADIDAALQFGCGYPPGFLGSANSWGIQKIETELMARHQVTNDPHHAPSPGLELLALVQEYAPAPVERVALDRAVSSVAVIGTGTMGSGIALAFATEGLDVTCVGRTSARAEAVRDHCARSLNRLVDKGRLAQRDMDAAMARLHTTGDVAGVAGADLVVEAVAEDFDVKATLLATLEEHCRTDAILATTTSSLSVERLAASTEHPARVIGMHFFNPATVMKLVEVVTTSRTAPAVAATVTELTHRIGKVPVACGDRAGFIVNALLFPYLNDAIRLVESGRASVDEVDEAMTGWSLPMGPFALLDVVGLDISVAILEQLNAEFSRPTLVPASSLLDLVAGGHLGRKSGRGFRDHT